MNCFDASPCPLQSQADRKKHLMTLAVEAVSQGREIFDADALLIRRPPHERRPGLSVVSQSPCYAIALIETERDVALGLRILNRLLDYQLTDRSRYDYGNWRWMHEWQRAEDPNAVSFMMVNLGYIWSNHFEKLNDPLRRRLQDAAALAGHAFLAHRCQWSYTNIYLKNILGKLIVANMTDDPRMLELAYWDWAEWQYYTDRFGITEYNSPTYTGVQLRCLEMMAEISEVDDGFRYQVKTVLEKLYCELMSHYHWPSQRITGAMSRCYEPAQLPDGHDHITAGFVYRHLGGPEPIPNTMLVHCAQSHYELSKNISDIAVKKNYPHRSRILSSFTNDLRTNYQTPVFALGCKSDGHAGISEVPLFLAWTSDSDRRTLYARSEPHGNTHFAHQDDHRILGAFRIEKSCEDNALPRIIGLPISVGIRTDQVPVECHQTHVRFFLGLSQDIKMHRSTGPLQSNESLRWTVGSITCFWQWMAHGDDPVHAMLALDDGQWRIDVTFDVNQCPDPFEAFAYTLVVQSQQEFQDVVNDKLIADENSEKSKWCLRALLDGNDLQLQVPMQPSS